MKKMILLFLLLQAFAYGQAYDLSGTWNGAVYRKEFGKCAYTIKLSLVDSCNGIYRVHEWEVDQGRLFNCEYNMVQINDSTVISDRVSYQKNNTPMKGYYWALDQTKLFFNRRNKTLIGEKLWQDTKLRENGDYVVTDYVFVTEDIFLQRQGSVTFLPRCCQTGATP